jgi:hypothetical protein
MSHTAFRAMITMVTAQPFSYRADSNHPIGRVASDTFAARLSSKGRE